MQTLRRINEMENKLTLEQANQKLEQTVRSMEDKSLTLQQSIDLYAQACELLAYCMKELDSYKGQIEEVNQRLKRMKNGEDKA